MALFMGVIVATIEISNDFSRSTRQIESTAEQLLELTLAAAAEAVYQLDVNQAQNLLNGLMQYELFVETAVFDELGQQLARVSRDRAEFTGLSALIDLPIQEIEYELPIPGEDNLSGSLTASLDVQAGLTSFYNSSVFNSITLMLEAIFFAVLIFLIVVYTVTNPVRNLARKLSLIEPGSEKRLDLEEAHRTDEIGNLINTANSYLDAASRYQLQLIHSRKNLQDTLDNLHEGVITVDEHGIIANINLACEKMFGYSQEEAVGLAYTNFLAEGQHQQFSDLTDKAILISTPSLTTIAKNREGNTFPIEISMSQTNLIDGQYGLWTVRDISERIQAENERLTLEDQLRHSQKMEAIGTLAGGIAHDFNNILGGIIGFTELAAMEADENSPIHEHLNHVLSGSDSAAQLIGRILAFSRKQEELKEPVDLVEIANECTALIQQTIPATIKLQRNFGADSFVVFSDAAMMHQVFMNLYTNAASAISNNPGEIILAMDYVDHENVPGLNLDDSTPTKPSAANQYVRITMQDTGPGIPEEEIHRVFEPYFTTKELHAGTGMGLALIHTIIDNHEGFVSASNSSTGAVFTLYLPAFEEKHEIAEGQGKNNSYKDSGTERILVVDDNDILANLLVQALSKKGYETVVASNGENALLEYMESDNQFDLVISDQTMPGMNGDALISKLFALRPDQATILCTGYSDSISEEEALAMGIKRYLMKPVSMTDLYRVVREVLDEAA